MKLSFKSAKKELYQSDLPKDYEIRRTDPYLQVRGVVQMGNKCQAYNAYGDVMTLTTNECKEYVDTGRVYKSDYIASKQSLPPSSVPTIHEPTQTAITQPIDR